MVQREIWLNGKSFQAFRDLKQENLEIVALGRKEFTDEMYRDFICDDDCFKDFKFKPKYHKVNFEGELKCEGCDDYLSKDEENFFYSALPPRNIGTLLRYIGAVKRQGFNVSVLIEKPFGISLADAKRLKALAERQNLIDDVFISDHYLFYSRLLSLGVTSFKNLKIVSLEKIGLENRSSYDEVGALKDMVQKSLPEYHLQIFGRAGKEFADFKVVNFTKGQYGNGKGSGYVKDLGKPSETETFVSLILETKEKHFEFITGKKFDKKESFMELDGKKVYLDTSVNPYSRLFSDFFAKNKKSFATIEQSLLAWEIIEKIESENPPLKYYKENAKADDVINGKFFFD